MACSWHVGFRLEGVTGCLRVKWSSQASKRGRGGDEVLDEKKLAAYRDNGKSNGKENGK